MKRLSGWLAESLKAASDVVAVGVLRATSRFGRELTGEGEAEQGMWREQRLRDLRGLAMMSKHRKNGPKG